MFYGEGQGLFCICGFVDFKTIGEAGSHAVDSAREASAEARERLSNAS